jgi:hypothetical protein
VSRLRRGLALAGFVLAFIGIMLEDERLVWAAIAGLAGSLIMRVILRRSAEKEPDTSL